MSMCSAYRVLRIVQAWFAAGKMSNLPSVARARLFNQFYFGLARACDSAASQAVQPVLSFEEATGLVHRGSNLVWQVLYFPQFTQKISTNKIIFQLAFSFEARCSLSQLAASRQRGPVIDTRPHSQRFAPLSSNNFLLGGTDVRQFRASHRSPLAPHLQRRTST